ncbi:MAG TPA: hypothetical protein VFX16_10200 [Pseudonocardiaceae bacterium]|nr:hypothetical protein [Pseudonocardiaceae bacterium]
MATKRNSPVWAGSILFATLIMLVIGVVNVIEGILTLTYRQRVVLVQDQLYVINVTGWGLAALVFGAILVCVGFGLLSARTWARIAAIVILVLHAIAQVAWLGAYPIWSLLMLTLDVVVLYTLAVRWPDVTATRRDFLPRSPDAVDRHVITTIPNGVNLQSTQDHAHSRT